MDELSKFPPARWVVETLWGFPINEILHILAISIVIGSVVLLSARAWGISAVSPVRLTRLVLPWLLGAFVVALASGITFVLAWPGDYLYNPAFRIKLLLLTLLLLVLGASLLTARREPAWLEGAARSPLSLRLLFLAATILVFGILLAGRLIPYLG